MQGFGQTFYIFNKMLKLFRLSWQTHMYNNI